MKEKLEELERIEVPEETVRKCVLIQLVDAATSKTTAAHFVKAETTDESP